MSTPVEPIVMRFLLLPVCWLRGHIFERGPMRMVTWHLDGRVTDESEHITRMLYCDRCGCQRPDAIVHRDGRIQDVTT